VLVGFAGVVIALLPSAATLTLPALIALGGSVFYALLMVATRMVKETDDIVLMSGQFLGTLIFGAVAAPLSWVTPTAYDMIFLSGFGAISIVALFCVNRSLKLAPASVVVPYQYTLILWGVLLGWRFFGEVPDVFTLAGAAIIVAAGLYIFWRERTVTRREPAFAEPP
jgi:drug/metabolite transporter (DMT)-like permease